MTPEGLGKITKLIALLASEHDGEVVAAVRAIGRILHAEKLDFNDLAKSVTPTIGLRAEKKVYPSARPYAGPYNPGPFNTGPTSAYERAEAEHAEWDFAKMRAQSEAALREFAEAVAKQNAEEGARRAAAMADEKTMYDEMWQELAYEFNDELTDEEVQFVAGLECVLGSLTGAEAARLRSIHKQRAGGL